MADDDPQDPAQMLAEMRVAIEPAPRSCVVHKS